jgi:hypothetical protein
MMHSCTSSSVLYNAKTTSELEIDATLMLMLMLMLIEFAVGKLDVKQRVLEGNDLLSPLVVQGDGNLGHSIFSSSVSRG